MILTKKKKMKNGWLTNDSSNSNSKPIFSFLYFQSSRSQGVSTQKPESAALGPTDAVLNCPGCMVLICHDCQR